MEKIDFKNKVVLVLGGTGDIGSAISDAFSNAGAGACAHGKSTGEYAADLGDDNAAEKLIAKVIEKNGRIDIIVNAISFPVDLKRFEDKTWPDFENHFNVQLKAAVLTTKSALPFMKKNGGQIINIITSYTLGDVPARLSDYISAKYALLGLTKALAKELAAYNIRVNAISPSFIRNNFTKTVPEKFDDILKAESPDGKLVTEKDVARQVLLLASKNDITGTNIEVTAQSYL